MQTDDAKGDVPSPGSQDVLSNGNGMRHLQNTRKEQEGTKGYRTQCKPPIAVRAAAEAAGVGGQGRTVVVRVADIAKHCIFMPATTLVDKQP